MSNSPQSSDIRHNSDRGISDFQISGRFLIKENSPNSKTSNHIDMNLRLAAKLDKKSRTTKKNFDDDLMLTNCDIIVTFSNLWSI